jgi:uncharacterized phiE125 gp8 family phage protein
VRVVVVTPPAGPVVELSQVKDHLNVSHDDDDALISAYIAAATANLDGPEGWLGRALGGQVLEARLHAFGCDPIILPYPPIASVQTVKYIDADGIEQMVDPSDYELLGTELDLAFEKIWPCPRGQREAVRIRYMAGYTTGNPAGTLHPSIHAAILLMVGDLYSNRETVAPGASAQATPVPMSTTVVNLLAPLRAWA